MRNKIIYWIATLWLSLGMLSTALVQIFRMKSKMAYITQLGYPDYFLTILGVWKILGVIAILAPGLRLVKEWAYAGFFFAMSGAVLSHIAAANQASDMLPALLLLVLTILSWYFRPLNRKFAIVHS